MIKRWPLGIALCWLLAATSLTYEKQAQASDTFVDFKVVDIGFFVESTHAWVQFSSAIPGIAACATTVPNWTKSFAFSISNDKGKALLSTLTAALLAGKKVNGKGTGACTTGLTWGPGSGAGTPSAANVELVQQLTVHAD